MLELAHDNPRNDLLQGRGQPGTHDMALGRRLLALLKTSPDGTTVDLPVYDKSRYQGQGDRSSNTVRIKMPLDVVIFEGWCMGFFPLTPVELQRRYHDCAKVRGEEEVWRDEGKGPFFASQPLESLLQINRLLGTYLEWYDYLDAFIQFKPDDLHNVFAWRLQAEHAMKQAGKQGMSDEQVHAFVAR
jgi:D-glycerate 3-kinase